MVNEDRPSRLSEVEGIDSVLARLRLTPTARLLGAVVVSLPFLVSGLMSALHMLVCVRAHVCACTGSRCCPFTCTSPNLCVLRWEGRWPLSCWIWDLSHPDGLPQASALRAQGAFLLMWVTGAIK